MDVFWYIVLCLLAAITYMAGTYRATPLNAFLFYGSLLSLGGLFLSQGIDIPGKGIDTSVPSVITFTSNSYTYSNNILVFAATWLCIFLGVYGIWKAIIKIQGEGLKADGTFR